MMDTLPHPAEDDYLRWKREFAGTPRGRDFLERYEEECRYVAKQEVAELVDELRSLLKRKATHAHRQADLLRVLRREFEEIGRYIEQTRSEIAALGPEQDGTSWINTARGELDAIVTATEQATYDILGAAEEVQRLVGALPREGVDAPLREALEGQVTAILTACSFQDITGQRTTKVVNALRFLEARVNSMIDIWGSSEAKSAIALVPGEGRPDAHLLNGPALTGGISQDDVDELMGAKVPPALAAAATASSSQADIDALFE
jgi:chemotaxis regulatin CheY-phosphate phosphatase CheZ